MATESIVWSEYYRGGSDNGYLGRYYNRINKMTVEGKSRTTLVNLGIGQLGITGFTVDWIARTYMW